MSVPVLPRSAPPFHNGESGYHLAFVLAFMVSLVFGFEMMRVFISGLTWTVGDRFGLGALYLGSIAFLVFGLSFTAGSIQKNIGTVRSLLLSMAGLGILRLAVQFWSGEPLVNFILAGAGVACFTQLLTNSMMFSAGMKNGTSIFITGLLGGVTIETGIQNVFTTYDPIWQSTVFSILVVSLLVGILAFSLFYLIRAKGNLLFTPQSGVGPKFLTWLAIGPFIFLQLVIFQNIARLVTLTGWQFPVAGIWVLTTDILALFFALKVFSYPAFSSRVFSFLLAIVMLFVTVYPSVEGIWAAVLNAAGTISLGLLSAIIITGSQSQGKRPAVSSIAFAGGVGMLLLVIFILTYYAVYQISLPYSNYQVAAVAAAIIGICGFFGANRLNLEFNVPRNMWRIPAAIVILMGLPFIQLFTWDQFDAESGKGLPVRVMTYNLHNGFDAWGDLEMNGLVDTINSGSADILILQEVSRGWLVDGSLDMISWLSQQIEMPYVFGPTADSFWGNAVFSRFPIQASEQYPLEPRDLPIKRGFTVLKIDAGDDIVLNVIATHLHHIEDDSAIRIVQVRQLLDYWDGQADTIIAGDFNARPFSQEIQMMNTAGLVDSLSVRDDQSVYTYHSADLYQRIDYIWISPDLEVLDSSVLQSQASDHQPVIATIGR